MGPMDNKKALSTQLWILTLKRASPEAAAWLASFPSMLSAGDFAAAFASISERLGDSRIILSKPEISALKSAGLKSAPRLWTLDALGRAALIASAAAELPQADFLLLLAQCAAQGERGYQAVLRALSLLPEVEHIPVA